MYTTTALIESVGTVPVAALQAWIEDKGQAYAPQYGKDGKYTLPPSDLAQIIIEECNRYPGHVVNSDLATCQMIVETAGFQSKYWRERNNAGGIGAINSNPDLAIKFSSPRAGVRAHVAHLLVYSAGVSGAWKNDDPRWNNVVAEGWDGKSKQWVQLNGKWAWPGKTYGQTIISMANALHNAAGTGGSVAEPEIIRRILPRDASNTPQRTMDWDWITVHNTGNSDPGSNALMHAAWLESLAKAGKKEPSWGYTVDDTRIVQHLEDDQCGWHASDDDGPGNFDSIGIELVEVGDFNKVMVNAAWLIAKKLKEKGKGTEWVQQHNHWARDRKNCPRLLRANGGAGWTRLLELIESHLQDAPSDYQFFPETGHGIGHAFKAYWASNGGLPIFGYPLTEELDEDGRTVQYFERSVFEFFPEHQDPYRVLLRRLGAIALEAKNAT